MARGITDNRLCAIGMMLLIVSEYGCGGGSRSSTSEGSVPAAGESDPFRSALEKCDPEPELVVETCAPAQHAIMRNPTALRRLSDGEFRRFFDFAFDAEGHDNYGFALYDISEFRSVLTKEYLRRHPDQVSQRLATILNGFCLDGTYPSLCAISQGMEAKLVSKCCFAPENETDQECAGDESTDPSRQQSYACFLVGRNERKKEDYMGAMRAFGASCARFSEHEDGTTNAFHASNCESIVELATMLHETAFDEEGRTILTQALGTERVKAYCGPGLGVRGQFCFRAAVALDDLVDTDQIAALLMGGCYGELDLAACERLETLQLAQPNLDELEILAAERKREADRELAKREREYAEKVRQREEERRRFLEEERQFEERMRDWERQMEEEDREFHEEQQRRAQEFENWYTQRRRDETSGTSWNRGWTSSAATGLSAPSGWVRSPENKKVKSRKSRGCKGPRKKGTACAARE